MRGSDRVRSIREPGRTVRNDFVSRGRDRHVHRPFTGSSYFPGMVSVVNGYVCFTSCDAAAARQGKNPAAPPGSLPGPSKDSSSAPGGRPATVLDGALKDLSNVQGPGGASSPSPAASGPQKIDLLI